MRALFYCLLVSFISFSLYAQDYKVIESNSDFIKIEFDFTNSYQIKDTAINGNIFNLIKGEKNFTEAAGKPSLPEVFISLGVPLSSNPTLKILNLHQTKFLNKIIIPYTDTLVQKIGQLKFDRQIYDNNSLVPLNAAIIQGEYWMRYARLAGILVSPFQFNPVTRELIFNDKITVQVNYSSSLNKTDAFISVNDKFTEDFLRTTVVNNKEAIKWVGKTLKIQAAKTENGYWYNPSKDYYKIYLNKEGVYRLTYDELISKNIPLQNIPFTKLQVFNLGKEVPLFYGDKNGNNIFDSGDYIEFIGSPPPPSSYAKINIYNNQNIYWFSYQADSVGMQYKSVNGFPETWDKTYDISLENLHFEKDSIYERLGHSPNDHRDYWFWGKAIWQNKTQLASFSAPFNRPLNMNIDSTYLTLRVNMQGITLINCINPDHHAVFAFTSQPVGEFRWDGAADATYEGKVDLNKVGIFSNNNFQVNVDGNLPDGDCSYSTAKDDEIRINWFEIEYWRDNRADQNHFTFKSIPGVTGKNRFNVFNWQRDNMKIFIPQRGEVILNPQITNDAYKSTLFTDSISERTQYFCAAEDYYLSPDSVIKDSPSNLRSTSNGADYIIITHEDFITAAQKLANFRAAHFPDASITNPRIYLAQVHDVYDEFSYGLLDPYALQSFVKYSFENWQSPAPSYVVLLGDMSYDYRHLLSNSRPNFVPSIPYQTITYGQAASDNIIAAVSGDDITPDLAIGRLSCETLDQANVLVNKLINYPSDNSKAWKKNVLLIASGQNENDESTYRFNDESLYLYKAFINPFGYSSTKVFRFPTKPAHYPFEGSGPEIRKGFDDGAVLANYYGHGGGYQWDLVFNNDDIYQLQNGGRLPVILSVTCYTAHFDNQDVFGEQFNKVPGKGSIGFWGSSGLTYWIKGRYINLLLFDQIFNQKDFVVGSAILRAKAQVDPFDPYNASQIALLTYLGDPAMKLALPEKPDFAVNPADIQLINTNEAIAGQAATVSVKIKNYGVVFPNDSVLVQLFASSSDTLFLVGSIKRPSFGLTDSILFTWVPKAGGLYNLNVKVNQDNSIDEIDHSDNEAAASFPVYDLGEPAVITPITGLAQTKNTVNFLFADNGSNLDVSLTYFIEIDTTTNFINPVVKSESINPLDGVVRWKSPALTNGIYFWRACIYNGHDSSKWSPVRTFAITADAKSGYNAAGKQLTLFETSNVTYSDSLKSLILNTDFLPPRPSNNKFLSNIYVQLPSDIKQLSAIATDGKYIYYGHIIYGNGVSKIYKIGTGHNGTVKGKEYGEIPGLTVSIAYQMFYYPDAEGGHLYIATGSAKNLLKVNTETGAASTVTIPSGLLNAEDATVRDGVFYITTDGRYVYNLAYKDASGNFKYTIRTLDPLDGWKQVNEDVVASDKSFQNFTGFFAAGGYFFPYENYQDGLMRRINIAAGSYEEEWITYLPYQGYYAWCYDWVNNLVYASVAKSGKTPLISVFIGKYFESAGYTKTQPIGPAYQWESISYDIDTQGSSGSYRVDLEGFNVFYKKWEIIYKNIQPLFLLSNVSANTYNALHLVVNMFDSSYSRSNPVKLKSVSLKYKTPPEIQVTKAAYTFTPDSVMQGLPINMKLKVANLGKVDAENVKVKYYLNPDKEAFADSSYLTDVVNVPADSAIDLIHSIKTNELVSTNLMKVVASSPLPEFYSSNNIVEKKFFVVKDTVKPAFSITFDGREISNGDVVPVKPKIIITLKDNGPLPLDTSFFSIRFDNAPLYIINPDVKYSYTPYPNSKAIITWTPTFTDGVHTLEIFAKDASNNYSDSTSTKLKFYVFYKPGLRNVFNYPNPFKSDTYFTFELLGYGIPQELKIKIYTIAGRLIKNMPIPASDLRIGFNKIYWDGRDQDGDEVANGIYFYKIIMRNNGVTKTETQKIAKVR